MKPIVGWIAEWEVSHLKTDIRKTYDIKRTKKAAQGHLGSSCRAKRIKITIEQIAAGEEV